MWETASYIVTVVGLPVAVAFYVLDRIKHRSNEEEETYIQLADEYVNFLKLALEHSDLRLLDPNSKNELDAEQQLRKSVLLGVLISLFERAFILTYRNGMRGSELRRWLSWEDWMREWCRHSDFRNAMQTHLPGEDEQFVTYLEALSAEEDTRR